MLLPLLKLRPRTLLIAAGVMLAIMAGFDVYSGFRTIRNHDLAMQAAKAESAKQPLSEEQKDGKKAWEDARKYINPSAEDLKKEHDMYAGSYFHLVAKRAATVKEWHSNPYYMTGWDMLTMMLVGIAFLKSGVLAGQRSEAFYWKLLLCSYAFGLPVGAFSAYRVWAVGFEPLQSVLTFTTYQAARLAMTFGHLSALLLMYKAGVLRGLFARLAAIGQTAFSNYILHSLIYGFVFYGYGLNLFDKMQRWKLYLVVAGMWTVSLVASPVWLRHYRFGPLEWAWRSLTYWKRQPIRMGTVVEVSVASAA